jgi:hypothetical protein
MIGWFCEAALSFSVDYAHAVVTEMHISGNPPPSRG